MSKSTLHPETHRDVSLDALPGHTFDEVERLIKHASNEQAKQITAAMLEYAKVKARLSPARFAQYVTAGTQDPYLTPPHIKALDDIVVDAAENQRFYVVSIPVRHGKSFLISRYTPAWFLGKYPDKHLMLISAAGEVAQDFSREARDLLDDHGQEVFGTRVRTDTRAVARWKPEDSRGGMFAVGIHGRINGRGADLIIVDDPIKNAEDAFSPTQKGKIRRIWDSTIRTRVEPGGSIIVVMARWAEDDLSGWLLQRSKETLGGFPWEEIRIPAIADREDDPMGREMGEALWPDRYPRQVLEAIKAEISPMSWDALYQQNPSPEGGLMFPTKAWQYVDIAPDQGQVVRTWDLAASDESDGYNVDYTVGVKMLRTGDGKTYIKDVVRVRDADPESVMRATAMADGPLCKIRFEQEPGATGKLHARHLVATALAGFDVDYAPSTGSKPVRAKGYSSQVKAKNVYLVRAPWNADFVEEHRSFPRGSHDDQVDAASMAYHYMVEMSGLASSNVVDLQRMRLAR